MLARLLLIVAALAIYATAARATNPNPGDPLYCGPQEGTTFLIVNGGTGVFTVNGDCFNNNIANNTHLTITTSHGGSLVGTNSGGSTNYVYTAPTATFQGLDSFAFFVTTVWNSAGGPGSAGSSTQGGPGGPTTLNVVLNVLPGSVALSDEKNTATLIPIPTGSVSNCTAPGNNNNGPSATDVVGCVNAVVHGAGSVINPAHGTLSTSGSTLLYTPTAGFVGYDTFTYQAQGVNTDGLHALSSGNITVTMAVASPIDTSQPSFNASGLGGLVYPAFTGGTLVLDQPGAVYSQAFTLDSSTTNTIDMAGKSATFSGVFSDATTGGNLVIADSGSGGSVTLSGINTYTGTTIVNGGTLEVDGSIATSSLTTVNANATLTGIGKVGNTTIASGGVFSPGNGTAGSSMTVAGSLALQSGAIYQVTLGSTSSSANVTGAATLGGATVNAVYGGSISKRYTILTAGSIIGTFGTLLNAPANFVSSLSYDSNDVYLNLTPNFSGPNTNRQGVGGALGRFFNSTGGLPAVYTSLTSTGLTQASGETGTGNQHTSFDAMSHFTTVVTDQSISGRSESGGAGGGNVAGYAEDDARAYAARRSPADALAAIPTKAPAAPFQQRWSVWAAGFGGSQSTDGNAAVGSNTSSSSIYGTAVGADYRLSPFTILGFSMAGGGTAFSVVNGGTGRSDLFQIGGFFRRSFGAAYLTGALAYGWQDITTHRTVTIAGIDQLQGRFNANTYSGRLEGGYRFVTPWAGGLGLTPYAAAQVTTFVLPAYAESVILGSNAFALAYGSQSVTDSRSELGLRTDKSFALQSAVLTLRGRAAWSHDYNPNNSASATFQALPGASFVVNGAANPRESALTTASAELKWLNGWSTTATFEGAFSGISRSYAGLGTVRYTW